MLDLYIYSKSKLFIHPIEIRYDIETMLSLIFFKRNLLESIRSQMIKKQKTMQGYKFVKKNSDKISRMEEVEGPKTSLVQFFHNV